MVWRTEWKVDVINLLSVERLNPEAYKDACSLK